MMEKEDFFNEENIQLLDPLLYFIYVGRFKRGGSRKSTARISMTDVSFQQLDKMNYESQLLQKYEEYSRENNKDYFEGAEEEGIEPEEEISPELYEENEDELIRIIMQKFINGDFK